MQCLPHAILSKRSDRFGFVVAQPRTADFWIRQTSTASPAEPGELSTD